jgi:hypothetical protein
VGVGYVGGSFNGGSFCGGRKFSMEGELDIRALFKNNQKLNKKVFKLKVRSNITA